MKLLIYIIITIILTVKSINNNKLLKSREILLKSIDRSLNNDLQPSYSYLLDNFIEDTDSHIILSHDKSKKLSTNQISAIDKEHSQNIPHLNELTQKIVEKHKNSNRKFDPFIDYFNTKRELSSTQTTSELTSESISESTSETSSKSSGETVSYAGINYYASDDCSGEVIGSPASLTNNCFISYDETNQTTFSYLIECNNQSNETLVKIYDSTDCSNYLETRYYDVDRCISNITSTLTNQLLSIKAYCSPYSQFNETGRYVIYPGIYNSSDENCDGNVINYNAIVTEFCFYDEEYDIGYQFGCNQYFDGPIISYFIGSSTCDSDSYATTDYIGSSCDVYYPQDYYSTDVIEYSQIFCYSYSNQQYDDEFEFNNYNYYYYYYYYDDQPSEVGYFNLRYSYDNNCTDSSSYLTGYLTGVCVVVYDDFGIAVSSVYAKCTDIKFSVYQYPYSIDCTGDYFYYHFNDLNDCQSTFGEGDGNSVYAYCSVGTELPTIDFNAAIGKAFDVANDSTSTSNCDDQVVTAYVAVPVDKCDFSVYRQCYDTELVVSIYNYDDCSSEAVVNTTYDIGCYPSYLLDANQSLLFNYYSLNCYLTNASTNYPTYYPTEYPTDFSSVYPTEFPTEFPTNESTNYPTNYPTSSPISPLVYEIYVIQVIDGLGYLNYSTNSTAYTLAIEYTIVSCVTNVSIDDIIFFYVYPPIEPTNQLTNELTTDSTTDSSSDYSYLTIDYIISSEYNVINQLNTSITNGLFNYYLAIYAIEFNANALVDATSNSATIISINSPSNQPISSPTNQPNSSPNNSSNNLSTGVIVAIVVGGVVGLFVIILIVYIRYRNKSSGNQTNNQTNKQTGKQLFSGDAVISNPITKPALTLFGRPNRDRDSNIGVAANNDL